MTCAQNDIQEILNTFYCFIENYENRSTDELSIEIIKNSFDAAYFVEKSIVEFDEKRILSQFITCLNSWLCSKNRTLLYDQNFYRVACDHMLLKYFQVKKDVEIAVTLYTSNCSRDRFKNVIENAIIQNVQMKYLTNYAFCNNFDVDNTELQTQLLLFKWKNECSKGNIDYVQESVRNMLQAYNVDKHLLCLLKVVSFNGVSSEEKLVQQFILNEILTQMDDRSKLSGNFWLTLIKETDQKLLAQVCLLFSDFLEKLVDFLIYCTCMMDYEICNNKRLWITNTNSVCPDISYENIITMIQSLVSSGEHLAQYIRLRIEDSKKNIETLIWEDIIKLCF